MRVTPKNKDRTEAGELETSGIIVNINIPHIASQLNLAVKFLEVRIKKGPRAVYILLGFQSHQEGVK